MYYISYFHYLIFLVINLSEIAFKLDFHLIFIFMEYALYYIYYVKQYQ